MERQEQTAHEMDVDAQARPAKHDHTKTNQDKCKEGPDISQICQIADIRDHCDAANDNTGPNSSDMRRAESRMNPARNIAATNRRAPWP